MKMEWKSEYSVKIKEIDDQHKKLFAFINSIDELVGKENIKNEITELVEGLIDYSIYHFNTEEKYFDKFDYIDSDKHKESHDDYKVKVAEFKKKIEDASDSDMTDIAYEILDFLEDWWVEHILHEDMKYAELFIKSGVK
jgi:hemerythrin-like metal-binding protein